MLSTRGGFVSGGTTGGGRRDATIYSHENALLRMSGALGKEKPLDTGLWPGNTFFNEQKRALLNGEAVELIHQPDAHTDGDVIVFFRRSDVISTGDIFVMTSFPMIDRARGGTIDGLIAALNTILDLVIPAPTQERGTMIVPGHGRLADEHDLLEYRDMMVIIRDRIQSHDREGHDARPGEGRAAGSRLRIAVGRGHRQLDDRDVRRSRLQQSQGRPGWRPGLTGRAQMKRTVFLFIVRRHAARGQRRPRPITPLRPRITKTSWR